MTDSPATVRRRRGVNPIWAVPIVAVLLGLWMVVYTIQSEGPDITITFSTAEGIEAGKTKIRLRSVEVGLVEELRLGDDLESVVVTASVEKEAEGLLREDTQFWVVRPRVGKSGVSGLGTLLSGGYIQLAPGEGAPGRRTFLGLEEPPVTPAGTPGVRLTLTAEKAGSVSAGDPILYKGYTVGRVESEAFEIESQEMAYSVFIDAPFDELVTTAHRFWDVSGISVQAGADGVKLDSVALETLLIGGVEIGLPENVQPGRKVDSGARFRLYESYADVNQRPYQESLAYVVRFSQSVRGLEPGAPVEYRGLRVGEVERLMLAEMTQHRDAQGQAIPVLIRVEPARLQEADTPEGAQATRAIIERAIGNGLRATLATGNLVTGARYVAMDFFPESEPAEQGEFEGRPTIPTIPSGLEGLEQKLTLFLDKLNDLPLEGTLAEAERTLASIEGLVGGEATQSLPRSLDETLQELQGTLASLSEESELQGRLLPMISELDRTLASLRQMLDTLGEQPNALLFNRKYRDDPRPPAGSP